MSENWPVFDQEELSRRIKWLTPLSMIDISRPGTLIRAVEELAELQRSVFIGEDDTSTQVREAATQMLVLLANHYERPLELSQPLLGQSSCCASVPEPSASK